ncbi:MAG: kelch repeat-containing protein [Chthoniobacteraceae bacterium]
MALRAPIAAFPAVLLFAALTLQAQVPQLVNYQGRVAVNGVNFDGSGQFKFALVNGNGAATFWSNDGTSTAGSQPAASVTLTVVSGLYSVLLGDATLPNMTTVPATVFTNPDVRLRVWFNDGSHGSQLLTPDQRIAAVGYAMMSGNVADGAITSAKLANGAVGTNQLANNSVGSAQLADGSITAGKIAAGAISGDLWIATGGGEPSARNAHTAVWSGSEMIVWGGFGGSYLNDGGRYNPALNTWSSVNTASAPSARGSHAAVWTGGEMIVWGGVGSGGHFNSGGRYNPVTNSWSATNLTGAPAARRLPSAVWTGSEMIVWGGGIGGGIQGVTKFGDGARYNPSNDTWAPTNPAGAPAARYLHTAVWTDTEMIIWGGFGAGLLSDGARYNPASNSWAATSPTSAPAARSGHTAVWTGTRMIIFGGSGVSNYDDGAGYDPPGNAWAAIASAAVPRFDHTAVWTGGEMLVWGGSSGAGYLNTGERYDPQTNTWRSFSNTGAPAARGGHTAVWSGMEMIVWGGADSNFFGDGARLRLSNILASSIGSAQIGVPLQFSGATASASTLSGANSATGGTGVAGVSAGGISGVGVSGDGGTGTGVKGVATGFSGIGVSGITAAGTGVYGESTNATGVRGDTATGIAVFGVSSGSGLAGRFDGNVNVFGKLQGLRGGATGVLGGDTAAVEGFGTGGGTGVRGVGGSPNGTGVSGIAGTNGYGIYGSSNTYAGWFNGAVNITGSLFKGGGAFRIDHPLDPANKYLSHSFVESPDMMNIYNGNVTLDGKGEAVVPLPAWFSALNKEFRYQLTCLGGFAPVYISEEITGNRFKIAGGKPGLKVSWQVTGIRQDAWANANRIQVEEDKAGMEQGSYLHPELFGQHAEKSIEWMRNPELMRQTKESPEGSSPPPQSGR